MAMQTASAHLALDDLLRWLPDHQEIATARNELGDGDFRSVVLIMEGDRIVDRRERFCFPEVGHEATIERVANDWIFDKIAGQA